MNATAANIGRKAMRFRVDASSPSVASQARALLAEHPHFHGRVDGFGLEYRDGTLVVNGTVPTFYLKQLLQQLLRATLGVRRVENRVAVASPCGLSSCPEERNAEPPGTMLTTLRLTARPRRPTPLRQPAG